MDLNITLGIVLLLGAVVMIAWGLTALVRRMRENVSREAKEPSNPHEAKKRYVRKLKEL